MKLHINRLMMAVVFLRIGGFLSAEDKPTLPKSLHWKFTREVGGEKVEGEIWYREGSERVETKLGKTTQLTLASHGHTYRWKVTEGVVSEASQIAESYPKTESILKRVQRARQEGRLAGEETVDGVVCEKWEWRHPVVVMTTLWLEKTQPLPRKQTDVGPGPGGTPSVLTESAHDIEVDKAFDDALFLPPKESQLR